MRRVATVKAFGGAQEQWVDASAACGCDMTVSVYLPPGGAPVPVVWWLSGLTCTDQNFVTKAGAQRIAAELGLAVVVPDTSPRGDHVPGDPDGAWDFGKGAGFYLDATQAPWSTNYRMYTWLRDELPARLGAALPRLDLTRQGISGHSMGGHGAFVLALRNPGRFRSVTAFAPICAPSEVDWGEKAFGRYLGPDRAAWREWDTCALLETAAERLPLLVDQGDADPFLAARLRPDRLRETCDRLGHPLTLRLQPGYDHSYSFIATFLEDHLRWHAARL